jgi:hypothetical protein
MEADHVNRPRPVVYTPAQSAAYIEPPNTLYARRRAIERAQQWEGAREEPTEPTFLHGSEFIRRAIHVLYRATMAGYDVAPDRLFGPDAWYSSAEGYLFALLPECVSMAGATFEEIESTPAPPQFVRLWSADVEFYKNHWSKKP